MLVGFFKNIVSWKCTFICSQNFREIINYKSSLSKQYEIWAVNYPFFHTVSSYSVVERLIEDKYFVKSTFSSREKSHLFSSFSVEMRTKAILRILRKNQHFSIKSTLLQNKRNDDLLSFLCKVVHFYSWKQGFF